MVKERENALSETDPYSVMDEVQGRFPKDDLRLHQAPTEIGAAVTASTANLNNNNNGNNSNKNDNIISNNNNNNKNDNNSSSNATTTALSGSPVFQDVSPSSPHASRFGQLAPKTGSDSGLASSPSTPSTPEDELGRDRKDTGSTNSCDYSGNSSPSLANRGGTSNINNNNNNNNSKKQEDKEAAMVSWFPTW